MPPSELPFIGNLYYLPLTQREDGVLEASRDADIRGADLPLVCDLEPTIRRNYQQIEGHVELSGRIYRIPVYQPKTENDYWYTIVNESLLPVYGADAEEGIPPEDLATLSAEHKQIEFSEALAPQESISIADAFIEPELVEVDGGGRAIRPISWAALGNMPRVVIVGGPGAGKTTALKRLAIQYLERWREDNKGLFPIYVQLRQVHEGLGFERTFVNKMIEGSEGISEGRGVNYLSDARIILLLDGLDEMPDAIREGTTVAIAAFASKRRIVSIIASTRESGYKWQIPTFRYVRVLPFTPEKIREWTYYRLRSDSESSRGWLNFMTCLDERTDLGDVAGNPLMLSLAVSLYRRNSNLPQNRAALLKSCFDAITEQWDSVRGVVRQRDAWASPARKLIALCGAAYRLRSSSRESFSDRDFSEWNRDLSIEVSILYSCERDTGVVVRDQATDLWRFSHRIFEDYLAAKYIIDHTYDSFRSLETIWNSGSWLDVWGYSCGIAQDATGLLAALLRSRRISKRRKIDALGAALEQDIITSSEVERACVLFLKTQITEFLVKPKKRRRPDKPMQRGSVIVFNSTATVRSEIASLLVTLIRLRKSKVGYQVLVWLQDRDEENCRALADIIGTSHTVSVVNTGPNASLIEVSVTNLLEKIARPVQETSVQ
jgi:hypothetical protein